MKKIVMLLAFLFIVAMVAGCVESNTPEATPMSTPTAIPRATLTTEMAPDIGNINLNALGQRIYTKLTPVMAEELRDIKGECQYCTHDWDYDIIIFEIDGELWWICEGHFDKYQPEDQRCSYTRKVTEREILRKYGYST